MAGWRPPESARPECCSAWKADGRALHDAARCDHVAMSLVVREMAAGEADLIINYFHGSTPEHLELLGVHPTRLPTPQRWREGFSEPSPRPFESARRCLSSGSWMARRSASLPPTRSS